MLGCAAATRVLSRSPAPGPAGRGSAARAIGGFWTHTSALVPTFQSPSTALNEGGNARRLDAYGRSEHRRRGKGRSSEPATGRIFVKWHNLDRSEPSAG